MLAAIFGLFLFASTAPSPLYGVYTARFHFSSVTLATVFAVYALALLATLLFTGSLSDMTGRRPVIFGALGLELVSVALFLVADGVVWLYVGRILQGVATGAVTGAVSAALVDLEPPADQGSPPSSTAPPLRRALLWARSRPARSCNTARAVAGRPDPVLTPSREPHRVP